MAIRWSKGLWAGLLLNWVKLSKGWNPVNCGSWLACDGIAAVCLEHRGARIAGKPAPTLIGFAQ